LEHKIDVNCITNKH